MSVTSLLRRQIPMTIISFCTLIILLDYFIVNATLSSAATYLQLWGTVNIAASVTVAGAIGSFIHFNNVRKRVPREWLYSVYFLVLFVVCLIVGFTLGSASTLFGWIVLQFETSTFKAMEGSVTLFIIAAVFRSFRLRSTESAILLGVFFIGVLGNIGIANTLWPGFGTWTGWLQTVMQVGVARTAGMIGFFGLIGQIIRRMLGYERGFYGED